MKRFQNIIFSTFTLLFTSTHAMSANKNECLISDDATRLACYDKLSSYQASLVSLTDETQKPPKILPQVLFYLRESGDFTNYATANIDNPPSSFLIQRDSGNSTTIVKAAAVALFRPINALGWQPFATVALDKNTSESSPTDIRSVHLGLSGSFWEAKETGATLFTTLRAIHSLNDPESIRTNRLILHTNVINRPWVLSRPADEVGKFFSLVPNFGLISESVTKNLLQGNRSSAYIGVRGTYSLENLLPRLSISGDYKRFIDLANTVDTEKRHANHGKVSLNYALFNTKAKDEKITDEEETKNIHFRPYLTLSHERGIDILGGSDIRKNKTVIGFKFSYN